MLRLSDSEPVYSGGTVCDRRFSPASTFKLPLAVMGFETGLLTDSQTPVVPYDPALNARFKSWRHATSPERWLRYSVIWYSQWLTTSVGITDFQAFVDKINYGNRDLSGTAGRNDGLTHAWLSSSLKISPREQAQFLVQLRQGTLDVPKSAIRKLEETAQVFETSDPQLRVIGKTGSAWKTRADGTRTKKQIGWFVGWTLNHETPSVFVHLRREDQPEKGFASARSRAELLETLPDLLGKPARD
ncbi:MAG: class D beta-lactamase [Thalassovita sp.]